MLRIIFCTFILSISTSFASNTDTNSQEQVSKPKSWETTFKKQARGIASTIHGEKEVIEIVNPPIDIQVE